jgi:DNA polymerase III subunit delta'
MHILSPEHNTTLVGQEQAADLFMQATTARLHHAWLLHGARGIGKTTFAYHCANFLLSNGRQKIGALNPQDADFKLIAAGAHPDLAVVAPPVDEKTGIVKDEIPVASVRVLSSFFQKTSGREGWRIALVCGADQMNRNAANALLKILEEPPQRALLLLTASTPGKLLPTIRSRCRPLALQPLSATAMADVLRGYQDGPDPAAMDALQRLSGGSPGVALRLLENDGLQLYRDFTSLMQTPPRALPEALLRFVGNGGKQEQERFNLVAGFCQDWLQRLVHLQATGEAREVLAGEGQLLRRMAMLKPVDRWFELMEACQTRWQTASQASLDKRLVLMNNLQQLLAA